METNKEAFALQDTKNRLTEGPIGQQMIRFAMPIFLGNLFQQLYNTADTLIVGNLLGSQALAAVSSSGSLIFLLIGLFNGIGSGAGVVIARYFGAQDEERLSKSIHTTLAIAIVSALLMTAGGVLLSPQILVWMDTPAEVLPDAVSYLQVYFAGALGMVMYSSCMGIMQALGDSKHPLYYLIFSSILNVALDIIFIAAFRGGVGSAALATVLSQLISVILCMRRLMRQKGAARVRLRKLGFDREMTALILRYGLPSGLQNSVIAIANVVVQSHINAFGEMAMAGSGAYTRVEGFAFLPVTSFTMALTTFVSQNLGAEEYERAKKGARYGMLCSMGIAELIGVLMFVFSPVILRAFTDETVANDYGVQKARICALFYCLLAYSHCASAVLRGAGHAMAPMAVMLAVWCVIRMAILWIFVPILQTIAIVNWVYPITWSISSAVLLIYYLSVDWVHGFQKKK